MEDRKKTLFLVAEDDDDDFLLIEKALESTQLNQYSLVRFIDGEKLMTYLFDYQENKKNKEESSGIVLFLDLNMPRKDGRQVLREVKSHPDLKKIPIVVLTTSPSDADVEQCYDLGANAYAMKPSSFAEFQDLMKMLTRHWLKSILVPTI